MQVTITRKIISSAPIVSGMFLLRIERELPAVPRKGDFVEMADGWASKEVETGAVFTANGEVIVSLKTTRTDNPELVAELQELVDNHGWRWVGNAPFDSRR
jgi:hypothetical protein